MAEAVVPAVISAGASLIGSSRAAGAISSGADAAAQAQLESTRLGIEAQREMFDISRADVEPWRVAGVGGLQQLAGGFGLNLEQTAQAGQPAGGQGAPVVGGSATPAAQRSRADAIAAAEEAGIERYRSGFLGSQGDSGQGRPEIGPIGLMENPGYEQYINRYLAGEVGEDPAGTTPETGQPAWTLSQAGDGSGDFNTPIEFAPGEFDAEDLYDDPGYEFRRQEGLKAQERSAAAAGMLGSGRGQKGIQRWAQDYASGEYQNAYNRWYGKAYDRYRSRVSDVSDRFNRLASFSGIGQTAATQQSGLAGQTGQTISNLYGQQGGALAGIAANQGNQLAGIYGSAGGNISNAVSSGYNNYLAQQNQQQFMGILQNAYGQGGGVTGAIGGYSGAGGGSPTMFNPMG